MLYNVSEEKQRLPSAAEALPGRAEAILTAEHHFVSGRELHGPHPEGMESVLFGMGCFWGVERLFWQIPGVWITSAGYAGGHTPNPTYRETVTGLTGHAEVVQVVYDPKLVSFEQLLTAFWEEHDPTQGMRQGNDVGTTYRSAIFCTMPEQLAAANASKQAYQKALVDAGAGAVTTEIAMAPTYYFAEAEHQQYLAKNPNGYCGLQGTGVSCPLPRAAS